MRLEMNRIPSKNNNIRTYRVNKVCLITITENMYFKMESIGFHTLINLFINHTKTSLSSIDKLF